MPNDLRVKHDDFFSPYKGQIPRLKILESSEIMGKVQKWEEEEFRTESLTQKNNFAAIRQKLHKNACQTLRAKYSNTEFFLVRIFLYSD